MQWTNPIGGRDRHDNTTHVQHAHHDAGEDEKNGFGGVIEKLDEQLVASREIEVWIATSGYR